jgi:hypothetical protein
VLQHKVRISGTLSFQNNRNLALSGMAKQETKQLPICAACNKAMVFMDAVGSTDGPIASFRCSGCSTLL